MEGINDDASSAAARRLEPDPGGTLFEEGLALYLRLRRAWRAEFHSPTGNPETLESLTRQLTALEESFPHLVKR